MGERERIVVAMSGGVDSSVAAARLHEAGHEVVGVTLHLWDYPENEGGSPHGRCCAPEDQYDAKRVADMLGFAHFTFDRRALFDERVVRPFVAAYLAGETPSPCVACNRGVKLGELFQIATRLGASRVATGHYARVVSDATGIARLALARDRSKDQSYFLFASPTQWLDRLVFPLGESTKAEVRAEAATRGLPGATKGESQELCFVGSGPHAYADFVSSRAEGRVRPGPIVDASGVLVGRHEGIHRFTVGQRRGLGVASGTPLFVNRIDAETATVHLAHGNALLASGADVTDVVLADRIALPLRARVRIRYRHDGSAASITATERGARVVFDEPVRAVTAGQMAVFYDDERVVGGGKIVATVPLAAPGGVPCAS